MLKKIFRTVDNLFKRSDTKSESKQNYVLEQKFISNNAIDTIKKLQKAGYEAYLVGGCIRDLLLNIQPKDFDVATNATPEQVKKVIRNSRIIGRRFKLVHVFWGRETIEVATFRGPHEQARADNESVQHSSGRILRDNVYGSMDQDAYRRDFTINAFYYDVTKKKLLDPIGGLKDIKNKTLAVIGDPTQRYQEDPVRMLRVVRFAAKLDFCVEPLSEAPIYHLSYLLADVPAARLFDEVLKLFLSGKALRVFELLCQYNLFKILFPKIGEVLSTSPQAEKFIRQALSNTDDRLNSGKTVNPAFLYATFLWPVLQQRLGQSSWLEKLPNLLELQEVANELIFEQSKYTTIPKRFGIPMREIWEAQIRLAKRQGKKADLLLSHPRFRAGYDFLLLRESVGEDTGGLGAWWTKYQQLDDQHRRVMMQDLSGNKKTTKRKYRYKPKVKKVEI
ncbi:polynucleotide adenylyltransferase PcnB [Entomomonas moraniae]|uniref:Poly(A) polymerase I n=1 Tax=Entomomonas moraniae TaxID=2213226 RepID=A0A3Q9JK04_9GAMM|nr:polynucleotide adenylyltransferase PcnB [Entomomonas moraniae]AZS51371.1 polynucleotide adenylyltransferase PcnB [Entomomonas moraniae]